MTEIWYRCEAYRQPHWDYEGEYVTGWSYSVQWIEYKVTHTPKGVQASLYGRTTFVLGKARKQLCVPTKELALRDAIIRAERHVWGAKARLNIAENLLRRLKNEDIQSS